MGLPKIRVPDFGVLIIRILLLRVLYWGPLFAETPYGIMTLCSFPEFTTLYMDPFGRHPLLASKPILLTVDDINP